MQITRHTKIDELVTAYPETVSLLIKEGLPCVVCGEPFWGTVGELAEQKGWTKEDIDNLVARLRHQFAPD
jgi:hypothetical protein